MFTTLYFLLQIDTSLYADPFRAWAIMAIHNVLSIFLKFETEGIPLTVSFVIPLHKIVRLATWVSLLSVGPLSVNSFKSSILIVSPTDFNCLSDSKFKGYLVCIFLKTTSALTSSVHVILSSLFCSKLTLHPGSGYSGSYAVTDLHRLSLCHQFPNQHLDDTNLVSVVNPVSLEKLSWPLLSKRPPISG